MAEAQEQVFYVLFFRYSLIGLREQIEKHPLATTEKSQQFIKDDRYSKFNGKMQVDKDFGTSVLKISPRRDHSDYYLARKLGLPILTVMNKDWTLYKVAGLYRQITNSEQNCKDEFMGIQLKLQYYHSIRRRLSKLQQILLRNALCFRYCHFLEL